MTILITGATGTIGGEIVKQLAAKNLPIRAFVRNPSKAARLKQLGVEIAQGDFLHQDTLEAALQGIEKAFLVTANDPRQVEMESNFIDAAQKAGVQHIVKLSVLAANQNSSSTFQRWHGQIEKHLEKSGIAWTHLQPNMLMQNIKWFAKTIAEQSSIFSTVGDAKISHVDAKDVAAVAAVCLSESGHENKSYVLTGAEAIAFNQVADKLAKTLNRPVTFVNVTAAQLKQARLAGGEPEWYLDAENELFALWASGTGSPVTSDIFDITKQSPTSFDEFARDLASEKALDFFNVERVADGFTFGEGPVYDQKQSCLLFCDTQGDTIYKLIADNIEVFRRPAGYPSGLAFDPQGRLVVCENAERRVTRTEKDGQIVTLADKFSGKRLNSPNDLVIRSDGTIYFSDPPYGLPEMSQGKELDFNGVYKISPDGELSLLIADIQLPNGMVFSPDERFLYVNDTQARIIHRFDVNFDGTLTGKCIFAQMTGDANDWGADGITVDAEGSIYSVGPGGVWVYSANGELKDRIYTPEVVTNVAWGDRDYKTLYLTGISSLYRIHRPVGGVTPK
ncbi:MAG: SMP-30/gluconolactonase/LRE family protein [Tolypothrix carrinoi HA7290-LM1]|jgi:sugar lactone lactonase YvrE/uncharacterized protein YbjT (DUF2867 family)|nr:SMP-30/gluconolactonase/LRE family protein [Tolypothrix carrinoi HA7290-LM1]